ncbi:hypothetical protein NHP190012_01890 [Helicobacter sp. NHP19-012]|uniref:Uncharacterized protein n=1 Tax=Helicobacter gastrofelis TaxID=2849642 RepID=A0ABN6I6C5_9HELI|nr:MULTISPECIES: hypothetical protein [unclassified Helicobacter]BCZ18547.1 hypothetical protein NHP190012_01890 [Helicobacter sp. NHP19-012]GMB95820.1 hypothetical protein NHP22001_04090 [Helicobacter sp. NHP22-001]
MSQPSISRYIPWIGFMGGFVLAMSAHLESIQQSLNAPKLDIAELPFVAAIVFLMGV